MNELLKAALDLQTLLDSRRWPFCIIGGIALIRWGTPRFTRDVDIALLTGFGREDEFTVPLLNSGYTGRVADAAAFARRNRVLLVNAPNGISLDISLACLPFEEAIRRGSMFEFVLGFAQPDLRVFRGSAEEVQSAFPNRCCLSSFPISLRREE